MRDKHQNAFHMASLCHVLHEEMPRRSRQAQPAVFSMALVMEVMMLCGSIEKHSLCQQAEGLSRCHLLSFSPMSLHFQR